MARAIKEVLEAGGGGGGVIKGGDGIFVVFELSFCSLPQPLALHMYPYYLLDSSAHLVFPLM